ncbi:hypothetical protein [Demequina oxidasica]|uniref:hypothetical protein n=1 Tax=Demequina oxidasica TaxID=676199 RepID=UPI0007806A0D|nr:hypothetical protein [Demequina oxidasica]
MNETTRASEYVGIYDADGGVRGELTYVVGHLIGTKHCALCDITHSPIRRKPEWKAMVARLGVPFRLLHRNEMPPDVAAAASGRELALVLAKVDGTWVEALTSRDLDAVYGDIPALEAALRARIGPAV